MRKTVLDLGSTSILSILLLSSPLNGQETGVLYQYESSSGFVLKSFGDGKVQPKYKGEITNGKSDGFGFMTYPYDGKNIVGEWKNGKEWNTQHQNKDGKIIKKKVNGKWEIQKFVLFRYRKKGIWGWYEDGDENRFLKYEGEIKNGKMDGLGVLIYPYGGKSVVGEWKDGKEWNTKHRNKDGKLIWNFEMEKNGLVTITYPDGDKYVGEFKDGGKNGQGTFTWSDGKKYVGEYKEDLMNGQGTISWSNMEKFVGEWKDGKQWNGTYYDKEGNIHSKVVNGKGQK